MSIYGGGEGSTTEDMSPIQMASHPPKAHPRDDEMEADLPISASW